MRVDFRTQNGREHLEERKCWCVVARAERRKFTLPSTLAVLLLVLITVTGCLIKVVLTLVQGKRKSLGGT